MQACGQGAVESCRRPAGEALGSCGMLSPVPRGRAALTRGWFPPAPPPPPTPPPQLNYESRTQGQKARRPQARPSGFRNPDARIDDSWLDPGARFSHAPPHPPRTPNRRQRPDVTRQGSRDWLSLTLPAPSPTVFRRPDTRWAKHLPLSWRRWSRGGVADPPLCPPRRVPSAGAAAAPKRESFHAVVALALHPRLKAP
ncbi:ESX-1 secretion-associated protein EspI isoform X2 [Oryctolagus cuniculus]|uniref:ESX-1 secretion-associated protein EspI isoform X2 n=1 Tax=Oryctolagus cuniculus TaxID=9986 RepID=UPI00387989E0